MTDTDFPDEIRAGTTVGLVFGWTAYPAPTWSLSIALRGAGSIDLASTPEGTDHAIDATAAATAAWAPGLYWWVATVTDGTEVVEVGSGQVKILESLAAIVDPTYDGRSHARRTLEAIEALIENRATMDQRRYRIGSRELERMTIEELLKLRNYYRSRVATEERKARGQGPFRQVKVHF